MSDEIIEVNIYKPKRIPDIYRPPLGLPLNWRDEVSGELPNAVFKYFDSQPLSAAEISLIVEYCQHYINAPCWDATGGFTTELAALRQTSASLSTVGEVNRWIHACIEIAIDPF